MLIVVNFGRFFIFRYLFFKLSYVFTADSERS
jgi:hypothetical protein